VYQELTYQARRLDHHASIAIWGGNNEIEVAFGWFPESRDPDKARLYAADYNQARARSRATATTQVTLLGGVQESNGHDARRSTLRPAIRAASAACGGPTCSRRCAARRAGGR
jgi:beta-galactosidase/beta-glucuronidase